MRQFIQELFFVLLSCFNEILLECFAFFEKFFIGNVIIFSEYFLQFCLSLNPFILFLLFPHYKLSLTYICSFVTLQGIATLEVLEAKVDNASTISIKEKYRQDMKREIKRLQRLRDIFRQNINNPAVQEQHRLVEARKRIETVSVQFKKTQT